jgi:hypothetical protein
MDVGIVSPLWGLLEFSMCTPGFRPGLPDRVGTKNTRNSFAPPGLAGS